MVYRALGIVVILAAVSIILFTLNPEIRWPLKATSEDCKQLTPAEQLVQLIDQDLKELKKQKQLPEQWGSLSYVDYRLNSELGRALLGSLRPHIPQTKDGVAFAEVEILDLPDEENPGIILQISLFDKKTNNKIFEVGRTYSMAQLNHISK